jgi:lipopolysaccharide biosynthesis protein
MKVIPMYLPQFHQIPENDEWWGEGFTEWTNVKKAKPLFEGHYQPRIPLNKNYYDLTDIDALKWQCKIAKEHGIYGFCFYHYWFNGHLLLEKPMELLLQHPEIDINYCISWANESWTKGWVSKSNEILMGHDFNDEQDWIHHFNYLLPFFKDPRYIKEDGKPLMTIYVPHHIPKLKKMLNLWNAMAIENDFPGLKFIYQNVNSHYDKTMDKSLFDYGIEFQPGFTSFSNASKRNQLLWIWAPKFSAWLHKHFGVHLGIFDKQGTVSILNYDETWQKILDHHPICENMIPSAFVDWDNTARRGERGSVYLEASPEKFKKYFSQLIINARETYKSDKIFVFAWNEWAEGGYLEPDEKFEFGYLNAIKEALVEQNELENI